MGMAKKFKSNLGGHVSIYVPWRPEPIEILEGQAYETEDKQELQALKASSEVFEVKEESKKKD